MIFRLIISNKKSHIFVFLLCLRQFSREQYLGFNQYLGFVILSIEQEVLTLTFLSSGKLKSK